MLTIRIRFESSWTNSFADGNGAARFTSGKSLQDSMKGLQAVPVDSGLNGKPGARVAYLRALQAANPDMRYRVPADYDDTVRGVLARLVGEVRRLRYLKEHRPDHLALRAFERGTYEVEIEHEHSETMRLATRAGNLVQGGGAGLARGALYDDPAVGQLLFGHLEATFDELLETLAAGRLPEGRWRVGSPGRLIERLAELAARQNERVKTARREAKANGHDYVSPIAPAVAALDASLGEQIAERIEAEREKTAKRNATAAGPSPPPSVESGAIDGWNLAGAIAVARVASLSENARAALVRRGVLTRRAGLSGIAMSGTVGAVTPKDVFRAATGRAATSHTVPYAVEVPIARNDGERDMGIASGVVVKSGWLHFTLKGDKALERALHKAIERASVGPFHFGKKGIAYVEELVRRAPRERIDV